MDSQFPGFFVFVFFFKGLIKRFLLQKEIALGSWHLETCRRHGERSAHEARVKVEASPGGCGASRARGLRLSLLSAYMF